MQVFGAQFDLCLQPIYEAKAKRFLVEMVSLGEVSFKYRTFTINILYFLLVLIRILFRTFSIKFASFYYIETDFFMFVEQHCDGK